MIIGLLTRPPGTGLSATSGMLAGQRPFSGSREPREHTSTRGLGMNEGGASLTC